jgi:Cu-processing system permease protein
MNAIIIMRKELRDAVRSRWLIAYAVAFTVLALALTLAGSGGDSLGSQGFNRTTAALINLCLFLVPMLALMVGADSIAGERERGTLVTLLAQPISKTELLLGKYLGTTIALWMAIALGFGAAGLAVALFSPLTDIGHYLLFILLSALLGSAMLSIGMFISVAAGGRLKALAFAVLAGFALVLFYDVGVISFALAAAPSGRALLLTVLANPVEAVRILAIMSIESDLQLLGPLGAYMSEEVGVRVSTVLLCAALAVWAVVPLALAGRVFATKDA